MALRGGTGCSQKMQLVVNTSAWENIRWDSWLAAKERFVERISPKKRPELEHIGGRLSVQELSWTSFAR